MYAPVYYLYYSSFKQLSMIMIMIMMSQHTNILECLKVNWVKKKNSPKNRSLIVS